MSWRIHGKSCQLSNSTNNPSSIIFIPSIFDFLLKSALKPYSILFLATLLLFGLAIYSASQHLDFHLHDTYIVIRRANIYGLLGLLLLSTWFISIGTKKLHSSVVLEWIQIILSLLAILCFFLPPNFFGGTSGGRGSYGFATLQQLNRMISFAIAAFVAAQLVLLTNILIGFIRKWRRQ